MRYFTSDHHFNHKNIIKYEQRPFTTIEEMDEQLVLKWNEVVQPNDEVWHLGDFSFGSRKQIRELREQLNGKIHILLGNHDRKDSLKATQWESIHEKGVSVPLELENGRKVFLTHRPKESAGPMTFICGHVHGKWNSTCERKRKGSVWNFNVSVEIHDYKPISEDDLIEWIEKELSVF